MIPNASTRQAIHKLAVSSFCPHNREQAIAQYLAVALERRSYNRDSLSPFGINWRVAKQAIRKAKRIKAATDWWAESAAGL
jgi:hypothetical protein